MENPVSPLDQPPAKPPRAKTLNQLCAADSVYQERLREIKEFHQREASEICRRDAIYRRLAIHKERFTHKVEKERRRVENRAKKAVIRYTSRLLEKHKWMQGELMKYEAMVEATSFGKESALNHLRDMVDYRREEIKQEAVANVRKILLARIPSPNPSHKKLDFHE